MFSERLKELRIESNLKQEDLANILGVTRNTISKYETGNREPSYDTLIKIANYFDISLDYLLCRTSTKTPHYVLSDTKSNPTFDKIITIIKNNFKNIDFIYSLLKFLEDNKRL